jgi:hypothetical protein
MAATRVFAFDLDARFSDLLNDEVRGMSFDHGLDTCLLVAGDQHKARGVRRDPVILRRCKLDRLDATRRGALAMERERLAHTMLPGACLDPLVDGAKHLFVVRHTFREVHSACILPHCAITNHPGKGLAGEGSVMPCGTVPRGCFAARTWSSGEFWVTSPREIIL